MDAVKIFDRLYTLLVQLKIALVILGVLILLGAVVFSRPYSYINDQGACIYVEPALFGDEKYSDCR